MIYRIIAAVSTMNISRIIILLKVIFLDLSAKAAMIGCNRMDSIAERERTRPICVLSKFL
jgi:hypothetical protein